jgi:Domain of unknown function (DUF4185)
MLKLNILVSLVGVGAILLCGCGARGSRSSTSLTQALSVHAIDMGTLATNPAIVGRDGGGSSRFQGYSVWLYGDTFLAHPDARGRTFLSNTWSFTHNFDPSGGTKDFEERRDAAQAPTMILEETPAESAFNAAHSGDRCQQRPCGALWDLWPSTIITDPVGNRAFVFYSVVVAMSGDFNFKGAGSSVAIWDHFDELPHRPRFDPPVVPDHPDLLFSQTEPDFGSAAVFVRGVLYVYACGDPIDGLDKSCKLAQVSPASVLDRRTWKFYAGRGQWSSSLGSAVPVFDGNDILSVSWNSYLQRYLAIYSSPFSRKVMLRLSPTPEGPWSDELLAFTALSPAEGGDVYDAQAHAEFDASGGQVVYVTYSRRLKAPLASEMRVVALHLQTTGPLPQ